MRGGLFGDYSRKFGMAPTLARGLAGATKRWENILDFVKGAGDHPVKSALARGGFAWLVFVAVHFLGGAQAAVLEKDFLIATFTTEDGMPQNSVHGIEQTPDGYLWIATYNGLARFDGVKFTVFNQANTPALSGSSLTQLHCDNAGRLWIVDENWQLVVWDGERFTRLSENSLPKGQMGLEGESPEGKVLVRRLTINDYFLHDNGRFTDWIWPGNEVGMTGLQVDRRGRLWSRRNGEWGARGDSIVSGPLAERGETLRAMRPCRSGGMWVAGNKGVYHYNEEKADRHFPCADEILDVTAMIEDREGHLWIGTWTQGLWHMDPQGHFTLYPVTRGKQPESVRALLEDSEGNVWVGTEGSGLFRVRRRVFKTYDAESGLAGEYIRSVARDSKDVLWIVNQAGLDRIDARAGAKISHVADIGVAWAVFADRRDGIWVGTFGGELWSFENGLRKEYRPANTNRTPAITVLFENEGALLVGTIAGLWELRDGKLSPLDTREIPGTATVRALARGPNGALYMGLGGGGLWRLEAGRWTRVAAGQFTENEIRAIHCDRDGTLWVATYERGLHRIKGEESFHFQSQVSNLPRQIGSIIEDANGNLWFGSVQGIATAARADLNRYADGSAAKLTPIRYTKTDGLHTVESSVGHQPLVCATSDGRLWFGTVKGLSVVDPKALSRNTVPPPVMIEEAQIFGKPSSKDRGDAPVVIDHPQLAVPMLVPPGSQRIELHYTALNFAAPERVHFRYRLEGQDWTDAGTRRVAYFQGLPPGDYKFRVVACNNDGVWNENGALAAITILPRFTETAWFRALIVAICGAWVLIAYRVRVAQLKSVNDLRLRIARDLHDEIGANLGSIGLNTDLLMNDEGITSAQRHDLSEIRGVASQTAQAVRDIVWFTNPNFDNTTGMIRRMRDVATLLMAGRKCTFEVANDPGTELALEFRRNVFSIFKEALHNIVKHSQATQVEIRINLAGEVMEMIISDNGRGFDPATGSSGNGVANLRRRAEEIGGTIEIESGAGKGTRIVLRAPFKRRSFLAEAFRIRANGRPDR